jgi:hypothetical protein
MLVLGIAYGIVEEGLVTQSLFNPGYGGGHLLDDGFLPVLGIAGPWTLSVLTLHAVWSTTVPIVLVESLVPDRRTTPWLRTPGLVVTAVLFVLGAGASAVATQATDPYLAPAGRLAGAALVAVLLIVLALRLPRAGAPAGQGPVPRPLVVCALGLVAGSMFIAGDDLLPGWIHFGVMVAVAVALAAGVGRWMLRPAWTPVHAFALAAGALLTYAWNGFPQPPFVPAAPAVDLAGNAVLALGAVVLLAVTASRFRRADRSAHEFRQVYPIRTTGG